MFSKCTIRPTSQLNTYHYTYIYIYVPNVECKYILISDVGKGRS